MTNKLIIICMAAILASACNNKTNTTAASGTAKKEACASDGCCKGKKKTAQTAESGKTESSVPMACKLTSPELQKRRTTVLESLRKQILEKKELSNGYAFRFPGTDQAIDELTDFIKTERECCGFFTFSLSANGDKKDAWLELTGGEGVKDFINTELEFY